MSGARAGRLKTRRASLIRQILNSEEVGGHDCWKSDLIVFKPLCQILYDISHYTHIKPMKQMKKLRLRD